MLKLFSIVAIVFGTLSTLIGFLEISVIASKPWPSRTALWTYIFTQDPNTKYIVIGIVFILVGTFILFKKVVNRRVDFS